MHYVVTAAAGQPSLDGIKTLVLSLLGTALVLLIAWRMLSAWVRRAYGELVAEIIAVVVVSLFVVVPDTGIGFINMLRTSVFGA